MAFSIFMLKKYFLPCCIVGLHLAVETCFEGVTIVEGGFLVMVGLS